jgi:hypothetical protein
MFLYPIEELLKPRLAVRYLKLLKQLPIGPCYPYLVRLTTYIHTYPDRNSLHLSTSILGYTQILIQEAASTKQSHKLTEMAPSRQTSPG